jgi:prophage tail gpP-like protein/phage tail protein X
LSTTYKTVAGDTFDSIARKRYGSEKDAQLIAQANPGAAEPLTAGTSLSVPARPDAPQNSPQAAESSTQDEVALLIDGRRFRFWDKFRITRSIDSMDTIDFGAPFNADAPGFKGTFKPFSFKPMSITVGGEPLFSGTIVAVNPLLENKQKTISVSGYSLPGVLNDCTAPASMFGKSGSLLEANGQTLKEIASNLAAPFGISVEFKADPGPAIIRVAIEPGEKVLSYLTKLAKKENLIISSSPSGKLVFSRPADGGQPVARLQQGAAPVLSVSPFFNPQNYYSHITGIEPMIVGLAGAQYTVKNPRLTGTVRPLTFTAPDTLDADIVAAVESKAGRMFANMVTYEVRVATWRDPSGKLWEPGASLTLTAADAMIYSEYEFIIKMVDFSRDSKTKAAILTLIIPGSFSGKIPEALPWDE